MSYQIAYTTHFHSLDNTRWDIDIYIEDYTGSPLEISLEGDEPCVIEWQETGKTDVVQSAICILRVSNESDRQMLQLMNHTNAYAIVSRNGKRYWKGHLDDAVYEEPYSFKDAYVTELTFSDFGILNRIPFDLHGKESVGAIVRYCLASAGLGFDDGYPVSLYTSLVEPNTQQPVTLDMLYINADRFATEGDSWDKATMQRDVLEDILRPLGLRIMQKNAQIFVYDIEYLRDHSDMQAYPVWKGTDAVLKGSETFGCYEVAFAPDAKETIAEIDLDPNDRHVPDRVFAWYHDEDLNERAEGFYIDLATVDLPDGRRPLTFKTRSHLSSSDEVGIPWRVKATRRDSPALMPTTILGNEYVRWPVVAPPGSTESVASALFRIDSGYLPLVPDRHQFQLRVTLDLLLSLLLNPAEDAAEWNVTSFGYDTLLNMTTYNNFWVKRMLRAYVPVKLELMDEQGNVVMHYRNTRTTPGQEYAPSPLAPGNGQWEAGTATFGDMLLAYYNDGLGATPFEDWATNRQTMAAYDDKASKHLPSLYRKREQGEYLPLPPRAGILRLTVSNCIYSAPYPSTYPETELIKRLNWQLYRNPEITIVKANLTDDDIDTDDIRERQKPRPLADHFNETVMAGTWAEGIAPSARGLLFDASGKVWEKFVKNGSVRTLQEHRLRSIVDQTIYPQPVISGTAELDVQFCAKREWSTPGVFLVTAIRQNLHQDTEELTMARIANAGGYVYEFSWSNPVCVKEKRMDYTFDWSDPVCAKIFEKDEKDENDN